MIYCLTIATLRQCPFEVSYINCAFLYAPLPDVQRFRKVREGFLFEHSEEDIIQINLYGTKEGPDI